MNNELITSIKEYLGEMDGELKEKNGRFEFTTVIAERKAFLSTKKLQYIVIFRIDETAKELKFTEMLKESGLGLSSGGDMDDMSPGYGFKASTYKTGMGGREGTIEEQSTLFGKDYTYKFDYAKTRKTFEQLAISSGYNFKYQITPMGL